MDALPLLCSLDCHLQQILERLLVLDELLDALVQLVERHAVMEERPPELGFVVDEGDLGDRGGCALGGEGVLVKANKVVEEPRWIEVRKEGRKMKRRKHQNMRTGDGE
jgi:hypothetical protein